MITVLTLLFVVWAVGFLLSTLNDTPAK